jgi:hypothetical protein
MDNIKILYGNFIETLSKLIQLFLFFFLYLNRNNSKLDIYDDAYGFKFLRLYNEILIIQINCFFISWRRILIYITPIQLKHLYLSMILIEMN